MARQHRIDGPGMWHHVMNRGICQRPIFENRWDARFFLSLVARAVRRGELEVHAFSLMGNHFHMLVRSRGRLAAAMRRIQSPYVRYYNRRTGRRGPLFEDRFRSRMVHTVAYRCILVRYIDDNAPNERLVAEAQHYPYASTRCYARRRGPKWLSRVWVESEVMRMDRSANYDPSRYAVRFPSRVSAPTREWVDHRICQGSDGKDALDDLIRASPEHVQEWLVERAKLADGRVPGQALASPLQVIEELSSLKREMGPWTIARGHQGVAVDAYSIAEPGLLRNLCRLSQQEIGTRLSLPRSTLQGRLRAHEQAIAEDPVYGKRPTNPVWLRS